VERKKRHEETPVAYLERTAAVQQESAHQILKGRKTVSNLGRNNTVMKNVCIDMTEM